MIVTARRAVILVVGGLCIVASGFSFIGEVSGNQGLWTLGGVVGMSRWTIMAFALCGIGFLAAGGNGDSRRLDELEQRIARLEPKPPMTGGVVVRD